MSDRRPTDQDRLSDLAADYCTVGVSATERQEFEELASRPENQKKVERIELTAAAIDLVYAFRHIESMPRGVHDRLLVAAGEFIGSGQLISKSQTSKVDLSPSRSTPDNRFSWREAVSLAVTAACLALLLSGYNPFARTVDQLVVDPPAVALTPTPVQRLDSLITAAPADLVDIGWKDLRKDVQNGTAGGRIVWSDSKQEGYMVFSGLPVNNPNVEQYQLWIFDTDKGQDHPVDGGVFDIAGTKQVVVPIDARIPVNKAVQFAITVEKPGGVVVSDKSRLPLLAEVVP